MKKLMTVLLVLVAFMATNLVSFADVNLTGVAKEIAARKSPIVITGTTTAKVAATFVVAQKAKKIVTYKVTYSTKTKKHSVVVTYPKIVVVKPPVVVKPVVVVPAAFNGTYYTWVNNKENSSLVKNPVAEYVNAMNVSDSTVYSVITKSITDKYPILTTGNTADKFERQYQQVLALDKWFEENTSYSDNTTITELLNGKAVKLPNGKFGAKCSSYATISAAVFQMLGIESSDVTNYGINHAWTVARFVDGSVYYFDFTNAEEKRTSLFFAYTEQTVNGPEGEVTTLMPNFSGGTCHAGATAAASFLNADGTIVKGTSNLELFNRAFAATN